MLRKFFCFVRRQASENAGRVNQQNPLDFAQRKFGFRPADTTIFFSVIFILFYLGTLRISSHKNENRLIQ